MDSDTESGAETTLTVIRVRTVLVPRLPTDLKPMMAIRRVFGGIFRRPANQPL